VSRCRTGTGTGSYSDSEDHRDAVEVMPVGLNVAGTAPGLKSVFSDASGPLTQIVLVKSSSTLGIEYRPGCRRLTAFRRPFL
jgi:hypothetical protein